MNYTGSWEKRDYLKEKIQEEKQRPFFSYSKTVVRRIRWASITKSDSRSELVAVGGLPGKQKNQIFTFSHIHTQKGKYLEF